NRSGAVAVAGAHAVRAGVAAADHDHMLALGQCLVGQAVAGHGLVLLAQEVHGEIHALEFAAGYRQVARGFRAAAHDHGVELGQQGIGRAHRQAIGHGVRRVADIGRGQELHALGFHLGNAAVDKRFFQLEVGDAVAHQAADAVALVQHRNRMAGARQLLRARQAGWPRAHHGHFLASLAHRHLRHDPALGPPLVDDGVLNGLDADRVAVDVERTGGLAGRRADPAGKFREVVGGMQDVQRAPPFLPVHQVVPVGDDVVDRASVVAERNAAVHAPGRLLPGLFVVQAHHELAPVLQALLRCFGGFLEPLEFHKTSDFSHGRSSGGQLFRAGRTPHFAQCAAVFGGHDLDEFAARGFPVAQDFAGAEAAGIAEVVFDEPAQDGFVGIALAAALDAVPVLAVVLRQLLGVRRNRFELDHGQVAALPEAAVRVPYVGDAARHAGGEVAAGAAQHHHGAAGHVFATVVAGAFDHGGRPRVALRKTLAGHAVEERFARQRAIQHGVADDDVVGPEPAEVIGRAHDDAAA